MSINMKNINLTFALLAAAITQVQAHNRTYYDTQFLAELWGGCDNTCCQYTWGPHDGEQCPTDILGDVIGSYAGQQYYCCTPWYYQWWAIIFVYIFLGLAVIGGIIICVVCCCPCCCCKSRKADNAPTGPAAVQITPQQVIQPTYAPAQRVVAGSAVSEQGIVYGDTDQCRPGATKCSRRFRLKQKVFICGFVPKGFPHTVLRKLNELKK